MLKPNKEFSYRQRSMDPGPLGSYVDAFASELTSLGHTRFTISNYADSARHFSAWLQQTNVALGSVDREVVDRFSHHVCLCGGSRRCERLSRHYVRRALRFIAFLIGRGLIAQLPMPVHDVVEPRVADYQHWLKCHRGLCELTIQRHGRMVMRLLAVLGRDPLTYDAALIRRTILAEAKQCSPSHVKTMTTALRGYLRFLAAAGICPPGLERAVPLVPQWRLSSLPRYLCAGDVERLITSCDLNAVHGIRDRAILLLFARLGLRVGDVGDMQLNDIDWGTGTVLVSGKGRRQVRLPLPQDVGDALLAYIDQARPIVPEKRLFLRACAPYKPFTNPSTISSVVKLALRRAGIVNAPSQGGNLLRHSAATAMLRGGATLQSVGAVLRHRSLDTTAHYAKVDLPMLQQIAQPWMGEWSC